MKESDLEFVSDWVSDMAMKDNGAVFMKRTDPNAHAPITYGDLRRLMTMAEKEITE